MSIVIAAYIDLAKL